MTKLAVPFTILQFAALLAFGGHAAAGVAAAGVVVLSLTRARGTRSAAQLGVELITAVAAIEAAGAVYQSLRPSIGGSWPAAAVPVALGVLTHVVVTTVAADFIAPLLRRAPDTRAWKQAALVRAQDTVVAASVAVVLVEIISVRHWALLAIVALPLYCLFRIHAAYLDGVQEDAQRAAVLGALSEGVASLDRAGRVTFWSDSLERMLDVPRGRVLGQTWSAALPSLAKSPLSRAVEAALGTESQSVSADVSLSTPAGARTFLVKTLSVSTGATLVWHDVTERRLEERTARRHEHRLALAATGAHDGWWEWDLSTGEFYASPRWKALLGLPDDAAITTADGWLTRVHADDLASLREALEAQRAGTSEILRLEHRLLHEDGSYRWFLCHAATAITPAGRASRFGGSLTDITERVQAQERLRTAGFLDPLTGLCNRALFVEGIGRRLDECRQRRVGGRFALLYLDLDRFKVVNDSLGHLVGDHMLAAVSRRLESCVRPGDSLARLGGDEFAILINHLAEDQQANAMAFRIQEALRAPLSIAGREVFTSASIGIAFGPAQYTDPDEIMRDADTAM